MESRKILNLFAISGGQVGRNCQKVCYLIQLCTGLVPFSVERVFRAPARLLALGNKLLETQQAVGMQISYCPSTPARHLTGEHPAGVKPRKTALSFMSHDRSLTVPCSNSFKNKWTSSLP